MVTRLGSNTGIPFVGYSSPEPDVTVSAVPVSDLVSAGSSVETTIKDVVYVDYSGAAYDSVWHLLIDPDATGITGVTYTALRPDIAGIDDVGRVNRVTDGIGEFLVKPSDRPGRKVKLAVSRVVGGTVREFDRYVAGSLGAAASAAVDSRIAVPGATQPIYTSQNHATATYVRGETCWAADQDLTCISPWNSTGANKWAGTAISPRHIIFAKHARIAVNATIRFVAADNTTVTRTMINRLDIAGTDLTIGLLDSDLPGSISFARVMPTDWADYLPSLDYDVKVPCLALDQQEKALVNELRLMGAWAAFDVPDNATRLSFYEPLISGDSGNPAFLRDSLGLVLLCTFTSGDAGSGPGVTYWSTEINAAMTTLGGGYQLTPANWSSYNNYGA